MDVSSKQNGAYSGRDRLSDLSDCILHTILSHLKAVQVVQTSLLSRRWRHLWLSAPSADIDCREFRTYWWKERSDSSLDGLKKHEIEKVLFGKFEDIVDNLLLHHSTRLLHILRLRIEDGMDEETARCMPRWIRRALSCAPAVLVIHYGAPIILPPRSPGTCRLTKLCLVQVSLHGGFEQQITAELPVLEDLRIKNSDLTSLSRIRSGTLKNLTLDCCHKTPSSVYHSSSLVIAAPRLVSLHLSIMFHTRASFIVAEAPPLVEASIGLLKKPRKKPRNWKPDCKLDRHILKDLSELLRSLFSSNVSSLKLAGFQKMMVDKGGFMLPVPNTDGIPQTSNTLKTSMRSDKSVHCPMLQWMLEEARDTVPLFGNLRTLILDSCEAGDKIQVLWCFLHNTPVLERVTLNNCKFSDGRTLGKSSLKPLSPNILDMPRELKLKSLEIRYDDKDAHQLKHQGTRPIDDVLSMIRAKLPATTLIQATKLPKKDKSELESS